MSKQIQPSEQPPAGWRFRLGVAIFVFSILLPVAGVPLVATLGFSAGTTASVSGSLLVGAEVLGICAIAVMGKSGFAYIKSHVIRFLKRYGPPKKVSRRRYTMGLVMFWVPILFGWGSVYAAKWIPGFISNPIPFAIVGDILLLVSLFVLGGDFWDKIRSLFIHDAEVKLPNGSQ
jgi:hypothetical protein